MPELSADEHAAAILDRLPIVFQENHGEVFLAWVSQAIRDAEAVKQARIDELTVELEDAHDSIRQQGERYQAQCEDEDKLEEKCARLEKEKGDAEAAQREHDAVVCDEIQRDSDERMRGYFGGNADKCAAAIRREWEVGDG